MPDTSHRVVISAKDILIKSVEGGSTWILRRSQEDPGGASGGELGGTRRSQSSQEEPGATRRSQE